MSEADGGEARRAWRLAGMPTRRSPLSVKATMLGVVRAPSAFSMTFALCGGGTERVSAHAGRAQPPGVAGQKPASATRLALHNRHTRVGGAQVDTNDLAALGAACVCDTAREAWSRE